MNNLVKQYRIIVIVGNRILIALIVVCPTRVCKSEEIKRRKVTGGNAPKIRA